MDDAMENILRLAEGVGQAIRLHPRYLKLVEADGKVSADKAASEAWEAYNRAYAGMVQKSQRGQPIEVDEKHRLERLKQAIASNDTLKAFLRAQADYAELMQQMNAAIFKAIGGEKGDGDGEGEPEPKA
jgi:cell fate (sporulation/competence/biofilm development) regulator YlbF (YheA/YmcA/DUF963 family)